MDQIRYLRGEGEGGGDQSLGMVVSKGAEVRSQMAAFGCPFALETDGEFRAGYWANGSGPPQGSSPTLRADLHDE
jgi:hypothetical protein